MPWKDLEKQGWIAAAYCHEIRIPMAEDQRMEYALAPQRNKYRVAAENPRKIPVLQALLAKHRGESILIIGMYLDQLEGIAAQLDAPLITGKTKVRGGVTIPGVLLKIKPCLWVIDRADSTAIPLPARQFLADLEGLKQLISGLMRRTQSR
jgi:DNA excision repair protein ERCC-3